MQEAEVALRRWKTIYDQLVQAKNRVAAASLHGACPPALQTEVASLMRSSDAALKELNDCIARMVDERAGNGSGGAVRTPAHQWPSAGSNQNFDVS